jgi:hypothetical protein
MLDAALNRHRVQAFSNLWNAANLLNTILSFDCFGDDGRAGEQSGPLKAESV